jgi:LDH2 family malate/lactate/ureidoglycolate dehydrogenase
MVLDMATSAAAYFSLVEAQREGKDIPNNIAYDDNGQITIDPIAAMKGALRVFDLNYKGSHIALMVEILAGALTGASMNDKNNSKNWGSLIIAINPEIFDDINEFRNRVHDICYRVKNAKKLDNVNEIFLPGENGDRLEKQNLENGYLYISTENLINLKKMAGLE